MAVQFQDYYQILGVSRDASKEDIQKAYRKLARQYHPDVSKEKNAEIQFKKISEAYEVLKNPETRKKYDLLGARWKAGDNFAPPSDWQQNVHFDFGSGSSEFKSRGFSSFFDMLFGEGFGKNFENASGFWSQTKAEPQIPKKQEITIELSLEEAYQGIEKEIRVSSKRLTVKIPPGTTEGMKIRLKGQDNVLLLIRLKPHPLFELKGLNLHAVLALTPWEAALGAKIPLALPAGRIHIKIPAQTQAGAKLRLKGKGFASKDKVGDLYVQLQLQNPPSLSAEEKELFARLAQVSSFNPRLQ